MGLSAHAVEAALAAATLTLLACLRQGRARGQWWSYHLAWPIWAGTAILLKSGLVLTLMSPNLTPPPLAWLLSWLFLLALLSPTLVLPARSIAVVNWLLALAATGLFWGDLIYFRSFNDFLAVSHFVYLTASQHQAPGQAGQFQLANLANRGDLVLLVDLLLTLPLTLLRCDAARPVGKARWLLPFLPTVAFIGGFAAWFLSSDPMASNQLGNRLYNWTHVRNRGLIAYHAYDLFHWVRPRLSAPEPAPDEMIRRRLEISRTTIGKSYPLFAKAAGCNVLMMQLESFQDFLIDRQVNGQEVTPFLNRLRKESLYASALDQTAAGSTSDTMFVMLNSLQPPSGGPFCFLFPTNETRALPRILDERGYSSLHVMPFDGAFWNTRVMADHFGFQRQLFSADLPPAQRGEEIGWGLSDAALFQRLVPILANTKQPNFCYVTTTMMHFPFVELRPHQKLLKLPPELEGTMAGRYLQLARFRDSSLELLVKEMQRKGLWESTVLVLCGDHRCRMPAVEYSRLGIPEPEPIRFRVPLLIHLPRAGQGLEFPAQVGQLDVAPTLLQLLGIDDAGQVFLGRNALAGQHASGSVYGYISNGQSALWAGQSLSDSSLCTLPDKRPLDKNLPLAAELYSQLAEEKQVSDTLLYGNRISQYAKRR